MLKPKKGEVRKPTKTISGVTPVAVMLPPRACEHGSCVYCPNLDVPQSYTPKSPVVLRASQVNYDSYKQVQARLKAFKVMNHPVEKIEMIIMGGTFLQYSKEFQYKFVKGCYDGLNGKKSRTLEQAKKLNEKAKCRCVALCVETRPDVCVEFIDRLRDFGCTRVELGVQIIDDVIYKKVNRGHSVKDVIETTKALKDAGFKVGYHIMPGLPGSDAKKDLKLFKKLFSDENFKPDQLKIYPCQVLQGAELEKIYWKKKYKPYTKEQTEKILIEMLKLVPRYCRVMRVMREIPPEYLVAGTTKIDLRKDIEEELRKDKTKLKEIRFREIGFNAQRESAHPPTLKLGSSPTLKLKVTKYRASGGDEYFLEIVNSKDVLFGLLRLRIVDGLATPKGVHPGGARTSSRPRNISKEIFTKGIIRELHVYGKALGLGERNTSGPQGGTPKVFGEPNTLQRAQHTGLGKWLMKEAEKIVKEKKINELSVISGIGVREYYKKLGYDLEGSYMAKEFN
jgi:elongator complex protein 3